MPFITLIGFVAGALTTLSFLPQLLKTWRTRSAGDLSVGMLIAFLAGVVLWLFFGLAIGATPIIAANAVTLLLAGTQLFLTLRYRRRTDR